MPAISTARAAELIETEFGIAKEALTIGAEPKALCHPHRGMWSDGLCEPCCRVRDRALAPINRLLGESLDNPIKMSDREGILELHKSVEYVRGLARAADAILKHHLPRYAELHLQAAEVAAKDGDARPAQWALENIKPGPGEKAVIDAPKLGPGGRDSGPGGVQVFVGIALGQVPASASTAQVVDVKATPVEEDE